ncbi:MAG TPA: hypothetical protein VLI55_15450 [Bryobacteraceae bacterium]|nr:hypothetical protein [Bryobacteraceae bacterium]
MAPSRSVLGFRFNGRYRVTARIEPFHPRVFLVHMHLLLDRFPFLQLRNVDFLGHDPLFFDVKHFRNYWNDERIPGAPRFLRPIDNAIRPNPLDLHAALPKLLFKNFLVAIDAFGDPDAARLNRRNVRMQFLRDNGNDKPGVLSGGWVYVSARHLRSVRVP